MDLVSIVMPAYKAQDHIVRAVNSVMDQTYNNWGLLIVSDDQFDYQTFLAEQGIQDKRIRNFSTGYMRAGVSAGRNVGIRSAQGQIVAVLDSDDMFYPDKLALFVPKVLEYGLVSCALEIRGDDDKVVRLAGDMDRDGVLNACEYKKVNVSSDAMIIFDQQIFSIFFDESLSVLEDLQFLIDCFGCTNEIYHFGASLHVYYKRPESLSNNEVSGERFVKVKKNMLENLRCGHQQIQSEKTREALISFLEMSLAAEERFGASGQSESLIFEDILDDMIARKQV